MALFGSSTAISNIRTDPLPEEGTFKVIKDIEDTINIQCTSQNTLDEENNLVS